MVYVDDEQIAWRGKVWCHMVADTPEELHEFAEALGLKRAWFQSESVFPHYDVSLSVRSKALSRGAVLADRRTLIECAKRMRQHLASRFDSELSNLFTVQKRIVS
jgi:hypothetical protein